MNLLRIGTISILLSSCTTLEVSGQVKTGYDISDVISKTYVASGGGWILTIKPEIIEAGLPPLEPINPVGSLQDNLQNKFKELRKKTVSDFCFQKRSDFLVRGYHYKKITENSFYVRDPKEPFAISIDTNVYDVKFATPDQSKEYEICVSVNLKPTELRNKFVGLTYREAIKQSPFKPNGEPIFNFKIIELDERILNEALLITDPMRINLIIKNGFIVDAFSDLERLLSGR